MTPTRAAVDAEGRKPEHVVALSGGHDSSALALRLQEVEPRDYTYVCTPTGDELPEMFEHWRRLGEMLGKRIVPVMAHVGLQGPASGEDDGAAGAVAPSDPQSGVRLMRTETVTVRHGENMGPIDWSHEAARDMPPIWREAEKSPDAFTYNGRPILALCMYDGWPYWTPKPAIHFIGPLNSGEWDFFNSYGVHEDSIQPRRPLKGAGA